MPDQSVHPDTIVAADDLGVFNYAPRSLRSRHSFYSLLALVMAGVTVIWLGFIQLRMGFGTPHYRIGDPLWCAVYENYEWPGAIGIGLAVLGLLQNGRKRTFSFLAIGIIVLTYVLLLPPMNFA